MQISRRAIGPAGHDEDESEFLCEEYSRVRDTRQDAVAAMNSNANPAWKLPRQFILLDSHQSRDISVWSYEKKEIQKIYDIAQIFLSISINWRIN